MTVETQPHPISDPLPRAILQPPRSAQAREWLSRIAKIAPVIEEYRVAAERDRVTPRAVIDAIRDQGLHRMWVGREFGGEQLDLATGSLVLRALAQIDASIAWQVGVQGAIGRLSDYLPEPTARKLFGENTELVVGGINPSGRAERVSGGFRLSGEWGFASAGTHAEWLVCAAFVTEGGAPVKRETGPEMRMVFVPSADAEFSDTWHTTGLRGTGSNNYRVADVFVPDDFTVDQAELLRPPSSRATPAYPVGYYDFGPFTTASTAVGIAQDALDSIKKVAIEKTPAGGTSTLAASHTAQEKLGRVEMLVHSSRLLLDDAAQQVTAFGETGGDALSALVRLTSSTVGEQAVAAVDIAHAMAGTGSLYTSSRLERAFRDVHAAVKHMTLSPTNFEMVGQYLLGGPLKMRR
ncbi:acyl-CoA dehydrogenase family protein [Nocardia vinacea]|uniref:acyl-CoA dehydrogenase family protein n=1 Tax=Nocardia vinacea TaxID=96468 RepID=UPI00031F1C97|nr:acyl-CoA dehydrogenase family protein [Nocardia vinacea]